MAAEHALDFDHKPVRNQTGTNPNEWTARMPVDHIRYDILAQEALRALVRNVLVDVAKNGLPGQHHFYVTFDTLADGVRISPRLRGQYPEDMTIVLQHQFWDLIVTDTGFEVGLSFNGIPERLVVPFATIKRFVDPSVQFALQFETISDQDGEDVTADDGAAEGENRKYPPAEHVHAIATRDPAPVPVPANPEPSSASGDDGGQPPAGGAEVVRLDRYRKT
jgi:hypothetical protein